MADIKIEHVTRTFANGAEAVHDVSLDVADGEFMILVGPSGCGKSTLLRMIVGLEDVTSGTIRIGDRDVTDLAPRERNLAMVFQDYALYPHLTVRENMEFPLKLRKLSKEDRAAKVGKAAEILELSELLDRKPAQLSGGQRQRVAMGRAIVREPAAFLLDEPLSNLDAKLRVQMRGEIADLQRRLHTTTIYVTHDQTEAMTLGDRVAVLRKGVVQQMAPPKDLYLRPRNVFVAGFIGSPAMNFFPAEVRDGKVRLPMAEFDLPRELEDYRQKLEGRQLLAAIRPEHFDDVALVGTRERDEGVHFSAQVDRLEWLGSELYAHFAVSKEGLSGGSAGLRDVAEELGDAGVREEHDELTIARIDPASEITQGSEAKFWLDIHRIHYFDAESGENLLLDAEGAEPVEPAEPAEPPEPAPADQPADESAGHVSVG
jgi:multiple sugar transport system ATP-binding protein